LAAEGGAMSGKSTLLDDAIATLRRHGLTPEVKNGGAHYKIRFVNAPGSKCLLIVSQSPSSQSAIHNNRAELRRLLRRPVR
jgi:hypothetical protein